VLNSVEVYEATLKADGTFVKKSTHFSKDRSPRPGETGTTRPAEAKRPEAPARKPSATVAALGERFVAAIASNDEKAYLSCWSTYEELMQFIENLPGAPKFTPEQMRENKEYQANVHKVAKKAFGEILANLRKAGLTPKTIKYHSVDASIRKKQGVEKVSSVDVYFTSPDKPGTIFYIWIDDAAKINGDWRFMDKPQSDIQVKP
jgi:hypothetical protein